MTDDDHTSETADAAADRIHGPREPERPEQAPPRADDAGPAPAGEESPPEAEPAAAEPPAPTAPDPVAESPRPRRSPRSPKQPSSEEPALRAAAGPPGRRSYRTSRRRSGPRAARLHGPRSGARPTASGPRRRTDATRSTCSRRKQATRVQELVPIRYGRMLVSPFTFFRGAASVMASDLSGGPRTGLEVQLCGDAHLSNFGVYAASDRRLVFDINDFDETLPGPFEWDLKRLVASFAIAGRDRGFDAKQRQAINRAVTRAYRTAMKDFAGMGTLAVWYARIDADEIVQLFQQQASKKQTMRIDRDVAKARTKDSLAAFAKLTHLVDGEPRIVGDPPLIVPVEDLVQPGESGGLEEFLHGLIRAYRQTLPGDRRRLLERFRYVHAARKVVGVGSVGTRAWIVLMVGRDESDPLFLQAKQAEASVLEPFLRKSAFSHHGQRVVEGQQLTQAASDIMLGWLRTTDVEGVDRDLLPPPALGLEGISRHRDDEPEDDADVRERVRLGARKEPRPLRGCDRDRELPRRLRCARPGTFRVRRELRGPERPRLPGAQDGSSIRPRESRDWRLTEPLQRRLEQRSGSPNTEQERSHGTSS